MESMPFQKGDRAVLAIGDAMVIGEAARLQQQILQHLDHNQSLILDLAAVHACDTAGVQLLLAAQRAARSAGKPFTITGLSAAVVRAYDRIGLTAEVVANSGRTVRQ